jgi:hypothetical protein
MPIGRVVDNLPAIAQKPVTSQDGRMVPSDFHLFRIHKKHLVGKQFATLM